MTIKDAIIGGYPIVESILCVLPICDKIIVNDGGSTDGTLETFKRIKSIWSNRIEIMNVPDYPTKGFELVDDVINKYIIPKIDSDWVISLEGDTIWHEKNIFNLLELMKTSKEYNSILQPGWDIQWCSKRAFKDFKSVRIARNLPGLKISEGGGGFSADGFKKTRTDYSMQGIPPEIEIEFPRFHFPYLFPGNFEERARRHVDLLETGNEFRKSFYKETKEQFKNTEFVKQNITPSPILPAIIKGMAGEPYYYIREDLFDFEWLKNTTGINYDLC